MNDPDEIRRLLDEATLWFVVGLGNSPERTAYGVAAALQAVCRQNDLLARTGFRTPPLIFC